MDKFSFILGAFQNWYFIYMGAHVEFITNVTDDTRVCVRTRVVESDFRKSNKSRMPKSFYVVFIRF